jgi:hypothetical protein
MNDSMRPARASAKGVTGLLRDILAELQSSARATLATETPAKNQKSAGPDASLGDLVDRLDERGFGLLFFILALPCIPPFVYVLPQIVSLPMLALSGQMAAGRASPWLPDAMRRQRFSISTMSQVLDRLEWFIRIFERLTHPRLLPVTGHGASRIVGGLLSIPAVSILVPLIGTNTVPAIGISIVALGLIERDGLMVILGLLVGVGWVFFLIAVIVFLGAEGLQIAFDWLKSII